MKVLHVRNVEEALPFGIETIGLHGIERGSRNGPVLVMPTPVTTMYKMPRERVMFHPERDANPFFHFFEGLWMIAGRNDVASVERYVSRMRSFSDDGVTLHGAYGYRWRHWFGRDQLEDIIYLLKENPEDRRCVLQMWDAENDLARVGKDVPCNTQAYFSINSFGYLDMTVCCRSNDMIWGAYGANAVHFSMLQEYMASAIGVPVGCYWQISNNYHAYLDTFTPLRHLANLVPDPMSSNVQKLQCYYTTGEVEPYKMVNGPRDQWDRDLKMFISEGAVLGLKDPFFRKVATPILLAHDAYKDFEGEERFTEALAAIEHCAATDWKLACKQWLDRRYAKWIVARDDGVQYDRGA